MPEPARRFQPEPEESLFPLAPFLVSLETVGIRATLRDYRRIALALRAGGTWNTRQLRGVLASLLVRDPEKEEPFRQHFARFFSLPDGAQEPFSPIDLARALEDLQRLKEGGWPPARADLRRPPAPRETRTPPGRRFGLKPAVALLLMVLVAVSGAVLWRHFAAPPPSTPQPAAPAPQRNAEKQAPAATSPSSPPMRSYPNAVSVEVRKVPTDRRYELRLAGVLLVAAPGYGLWLWWLWRRRSRGPAPPEVGEGLPRLFRTDEIGGAADPLLDRETLDRLADSLGYFRSEVVGRELDIRASIEATARWGGVPCPVFATHRQIRSVILLEDLFAEAFSWNTVAAELAAGLALRGVPLLRGFFRGIPDRFRLENGLEIHLEDLEDDRRGYLVLVFTDGKGLTSPRAARALETLARWPQVAWMQLEEPRAWDQSAAFAARSGLRVFPASRAGLLQVVDRFTSEIAAEPPISTPPERWKGLPPRPLAGRLAEYVETLLGDSLLWAQACAMVTAPFSLGLADRVRERFHRDLPPERRQRLLSLPGTMRSAGGLTFSREVIAVLREGFRFRRSPAAQDEVLAFLVERIREAEPPDAASRAHQAWEWRLERVRLEHDPDPALERLAVLSQGPLRRAILGDLSVLRPAPGGWGPEPVSIPLPVHPQSRQGKRLLSDVLAGRPLAPSSLPALWQRVGVVTASCFLVWLAVWLIMAWVAPRGAYITVRSGEQGLRGLAQLEMRVGQDWQPVGGGVMQLGDNERKTIFSGLYGDKEYRLFVLANALNQRFLLPKTRESLDVIVVHEPRGLPCSETVPYLGLTIERCLGSSPLARDKNNHGLRIGLLLQTGKEQGKSVIDRLSGPFGLDTLYTLRLSGQSSSLEKGIERIAKDWEPWTSHLTLVYEGEPALVAGLSLDKIFGSPTALPVDKRIQLFERVDTIEKIRVALELEKILSTKNQGGTALAVAVPPPASPKGAGARENGSTSNPSTVVPQSSTPGEVASLGPSEPPKNQDREYPSPSGNTNTVARSSSRETMYWKVGEYVHEDLSQLHLRHPLGIRNTTLSSDIDMGVFPLPPGVSFTAKVLQGVPTEGGIWESEVLLGYKDLFNTRSLSSVILTIKIQDLRCSAMGETLCGKDCIEMQRLSLPFHAGACFAISPSLQKAAAERVDQPPPWSDESLQPRHYYRLYYEWNESHTAVVVRSLRTVSRWDRGSTPPPIALVLPVKDLAQRKHQFLPTDLEVHCVGRVRVASFSSARRQGFEKLSTSDRWIENKATDWPSSPANATDQALTETLGTILKQWEEICARGH